MLLLFLLFVFVFYNFRSLQLRWYFRIQTNPMKTFVIMVLSFFRISMWTFYFASDKLCGSRLVRRNESTIKRYWKQERYEDESASHITHNVISSSDSTQQLIKIPQSRQIQGLWYFFFDNCDAWWPSFLVSRFPLEFDLAHNSYYIMKRQQSYHPNSTKNWIFIICLFVWIN